MVVRSGEGHLVASCLIAVLCAGICISTSNRTLYVVQFLSCIVLSHYFVFSNWAVLPVDRGNAASFGCSIALLFDDRILEKEVRFHVGG